MAIHFSAAEMAARKQPACSRRWRRERLDGLLLFAQESDVLADRLRQFRLLLLPVPLRRRRRPRGAADPLGRSAPGAPHLRHRRHPHLEGRRRRRPGAATCAPCSTISARGGRLGVEFDTHGLTAFNGRRLEAALAGRERSSTPPRLVARPARDQIARRKSPMSREAARLSDARRPRRRSTRRGRRRRGRHPRRHASCDLRRRRRLSRQRIHHRLRPRRAALPLQERPPQLDDRRPAHAGIRRRLPPLPRRDHAHPCRSAVPKPLHRALSRRRARGAATPAPPSCGPAAPPATCSRRMPACSTRTAWPRIG